MNNIAQASTQHLNCPPLEQAVVRLVQDLTLDNLNEAAQEGMSRLVRDQIGLQIGIASMPWSRQVLSYALAQRREGRSRVAASDVTLSAADAALVNAAYGHGFEYDDAHGPSHSHPGSCVIPAAFAIGEELNSTFGEVLTAIAAGYEVYTRIGVLAAPDLLKRGFHPHAVLSVFGAAAVAAKLRKFDAETTLHALSIALSHASGTTEYSSTGGSIKRTHAGIGTRNGMIAADMADAGITGPRAFLSGSKGFFQTFLQRDAGAGAEAAFALEHPLEIGTVWLKAYCACYCTHAYIDAISPYANRHEVIEGIEVGIHPAFDVIVGTSNANAFEPKNIEHVQYSLPTQMAFALLGLGNGFRTHNAYMLGHIDMEPVLQMARSIQITVVPELEKLYPGKFVADVTVRFKDGTCEKVFVENPLGSLASPLPESAQITKFLELTNEVLGEERAHTLLDTLKAMDRSMKISAVTALYCA